MDLLRCHRRARRADHGIGFRQDRFIIGREFARRRQHAAELFGDHRQRALRQVAEIVGEVGIDARDDGLVVVVSVLPERHLAQEEIADLVDAILVGEIEGVDDIADRFRHLLAPAEQEAVGVNALLHGDARRHQERWPVHRVEANDVLADDVQIGRPETPIPVGLIGEADARDVIGERIDPDVHHVIGGVRYLHAPVESGARDREVLQAAFDEAHHLIAACVRADEIGLALIERQKLVLIGRQPEKIGLFLDPFHRRALRAATDIVLADGGFVLAVVGLVAHRIPAGIDVDIDIAVLLHAIPDGLA